MNVENVRVILERTFEMPVAESDAQIVLDRLVELQAKEADKKFCQEYCEHCGDCLSCYGDDPCVVSADGKHSKAAEHRAHPTLLESADLQALSTPEHSATSQTDQTPQQRG